MTTFEDDSENFHFLDEDPPSIDDLSALIRESLGEEIGDQAGEITNKEISEIYNFLENMHVSGVSEMTTEEAAIIWSSLLKNTSLVEDMTYTLMDRKAKLNYSEYPMGITLLDLINYSTSFSHPQNLRYWFVGNKAVKGLKNYGVNEDTAMDLSYFEIKGKRMGSSMRFLGWLATQKYLSSTRSVLMKEQDKRHLEVADIAAAFTLETHKHLTAHQKRAEYYNPAFEMERHAYDFTHESVVRGLQGIYETCFRKFTLDNSKK
jgi:hypothetical protein